MTRERPIAPGRTLRHAGLVGGAALAVLAGTILAAAAQDGGAAQPEESEAFTARRSGRGVGIDRGSNGVPALRGLDTGPDQTGGEANASVGDDPPVGVANGGEGISRLPRFRPGGGSSVSPVTGGASVTRPSLLRQRAAPPRRIGSPTRRITQERTQTVVTDLRLSPIIQNPVSGVPLPTPIPLLGLGNPSGLLLGTALSRPLAVADDAYAPLGIRLGTFTILPAFTQSVGYDTNPDQIGGSTVRPSPVLRSEGEILFRSDWSASELAGELRAGYLEYPSNEEASRPNVAGSTRLRLDVNRDTRVDLETRLVVDTLRVGSPELSAASASRPIFATYGGSAGVTETFNRVQLSLRGSIDRQIFEDGRLSDGTTLIQSDRDANQYAVRLRAGYELSPAVIPFVETLLDTRVYDSRQDQFGFRRDSDGIAFSAGATLQLTRWLAGEVSIGTQHRAYVDPRLRAIDAPLINTALIWSISPLTTVRLNAQSGIVETILPGSAGVLTDAVTAELQHDLLRNLSVTLGAAYLSNDYQGVPIREKGFSATARLDYRFNRWLTFRGSYIYQTLDSTDPLSSFTANTVLLGLRISP